MRVGASLGCETSSLTATSRRSEKKLEVRSDKKDRHITSRFSTEVQARHPARHDVAEFTGTRKLELRVRLFSGKKVDVVVDDGERKVIIDL